MKSLAQMELHLNKTTNTIRILSVLIICITATFILGVSIGETKLPSIINRMIFFILGSGITLMIISEILWKIIKKYGNTEERLFYFYNHDKNLYE